MKILNNPLVLAFYFTITTVPITILLIINGGPFLILGLLMLLSSTAVDIISASKKIRYDEYQVNQLQIHFIVTGLLYPLSLPIFAYLLLLNNYNTLVLTLVYLIAIWVLTAISNIVFIAKNTI